MSNIPGLTLQKNEFSPRGPISSTNRDKRFVQDRFFTARTNEFDNTDGSNKNEKVNDKDEGNVTSGQFDSNNQNNSSDSSGSGSGSGSGSVSAAAAAAFAYADLHHLTTLPPSIEKFVEATFSIDKLEMALQSKIDFHTTRDSDRFRQVLKLFKSQSQLSDVEVMGINKAQFQQVLAWLGLFATKEQANHLFDRYDVNGDGSLTVHEFLTRCRPKDYNGTNWYEPDYSPPPRGSRGKKQYLRRKLAGLPTPPRTPLTSVYALNTARIASRLREKLRIHAASGATHSNARAKKQLLRLFLFQDRDRRGYLNRYDTQRALDAANFSVGSHHIDMLMKEFGKDIVNDNAQQQASGPIEYFDYNKFVDSVYPDMDDYNNNSFDNSETSTSLPLYEEEYRRKEMALKEKEEKENEKLRNIAERKAQDRAIVHQLVHNNNNNNNTNNNTLSVTQSTNNNSISNNPYSLPLVQDNRRSGPEYLLPINNNKTSTNGPYSSRSFVPGPLANTGPVSARPLTGRNGAYFGYDRSGNYFNSLNPQFNNSTSSIPGYSNYNNVTSTNPNQSLGFTLPQPRVAVIKQNGYASTRTR